MKPRRSRLFLICLTWLLAGLVSSAWAEVGRVMYQAQGNYLIVEFLDDDLVHLEYGSGTGPDTAEPLAVTPMIAKTDYSGPSALTDDGNGVIETPDLRLTVDLSNLFVTLVDKTKNNLQLTTIAPVGLGQDPKGLEATYSGELDVYGLGQQFVDPGQSDIDWEDRVREGGEFGNLMAGFNGGANGNTQIPILFAVKGASFDNYALFLDNQYKHRWDFNGDSKWKVDTFGGPLRFYLMTGPDLPDLRADYMELVGHPLVPPKKMFGLWVSEYGYDDWGELDAKLAGLLDNDFPLDGFVLDLQWFGGIQSGSEQTQMGSLTWDETRFPDPAGKIGELNDQFGVGTMLIEEAYVGKALPEHTDLAGRGCLATNCSDGQPAYIDVNPWWGKGGMIDYTNDACADYWHDTKRQPLIQDGVIGHWTDLGEPEMYKSDSCYADGTHKDIHNLFNFEWLQGINRGYGRGQSQQRPFMMSRSGAAGIQRLGAAMWSGDIGARLSSLAAHAANQMHMSFSGMDYYGGDIGGFHRNLDGDLDEMYTRWYAYGMLFDIPGRPHTENLCNCKETAPDRIGDLQSNLHNTRLRYELIPYFYTLAHRAHRFGEPVMPPPVFYYQADDQLRHMGDQKLIGRDLLAAVSTTYGEEQRDVYLPDGVWYDWYSHRRLESNGGRTTTAPLFRSGRFSLPLYARAGAVIPVQFVDEDTRNAVGKRGDGSIRDELMAKVFAGSTPSEFTLFEDDGRTTAYQGAAVRETRIAQHQDGEQVVVTVGEAQGTYAGAPDARNRVIALVAALGNAQASARDVTLDGQPLAEQATQDAFAGADAGWFNDTAAGTIWLKSGVGPVASAREFVVTLEPSSCTSQFSSISLPGEENGWDPADPSRSLQCTDANVWTGQVRMCGGGFKFAADGAWVRNWGADGNQDGPNFAPLAETGIFAVTFDENNPANPLFQLIDGAPGLCGVSASFVCENGHTTWGTSAYVVGNVPELGSWNTDAAAKLDPNGPYPTWTGRIEQLPPSTPVEWKCIKRLEAGEHPPVVQWQSGENNAFTTPAAGHAGTQVGSF